MNASRLKPIHSPVSEDELTIFRYLRDKGMTRREISALTGRSTRTIDRFLPPEPDSPRRQQYDHTKHLAAYNAARPSQANHRLHLERLHAANGYGFGWLPERLAERFYSLEAPMPRGREFWRAS